MGLGPRLANYMYGSIVVLTDDGSCKHNGGTCVSKEWLPVLHLPIHLLITLSVLIITYSYQLICMQCGYSAELEPLVPWLKLSRKRTVSFSRGTVVPPDYKGNDKMINIIR